MKLYSLLIVIVFLAGEVSFADIKSVNIQDRMQTQEYMKARYNSLFGKPELRNVKALKRALEENNNYSFNKWNRALKLIKILEKSIPEKSISSPCLLESC